MSYTEQDHVAVLNVLNNLLADNVQEAARQKQQLEAADSAKFAGILTLLQLATAQGATTGAAVAKMTGPKETSEAEVLRRFGKLDLSELYEYLTMGSSISEAAKFRIAARAVLDKKDSGGSKIPWPKSISEIPEGKMQKLNAGTFGYSWKTVDDPSYKGKGPASPREAASAPSISFSAPSGPSSSGPSAGVAAGEKAVGGYTRAALEAAGYADHRSFITDNKDSVTSGKKYSAKGTKEVMKSTALELWDELAGGGGPSSSSASSGDVTPPRAPSPTMEDPLAGAGKDDDKAPPAGGDSPYDTMTFAQLKAAARAHPNYSQGNPPLTSTAVVKAWLEAPEQQVSAPEGSLRGAVATAAETLEDKALSSSSSAASSAVELGAEKMSASDIGKLTVDELKAELEKIDSGKYNSEVYKKNGSGGKGQWVKKDFVNALREENDLPAQEHFSEDHEEEIDFSEFPLDF